jgi:hypothetical protein
MMCYNVDAWYLCLRALLLMLMLLLLLEKGGRWSFVSARHFRATC